MIALISSVTIGNGVTSIENKAFSSCEDLIFITLGKNVKKIDSTAFEHCRNITEICNLSEIKLTAGVNNYGGIALNALNIYSPENGSSKTRTEGDFLFFDDVEISYLLYYSGSDASVVIPDSFNGKIHGIYKNAFSRNRYVTDITIPESVTYIGEGAFYDCPYLKSINLPYGISKIENHLFLGTPMLSSIEIPDTVTSIGNSAFYNSAITNIEIPDGVTSIGEYAFSGCNFASIEIPDSVTSIGEGAFLGCKSLVSVKLSANITMIPKMAFSNCALLKSINIPKSVEIISQEVFSDCPELSEVTYEGTVDEYRNCIGTVYHGSEITVKCTDGKITHLSYDKKVIEMYNS